MAPRLSGLPRAAFGGALAHAGVGVLMIGIPGVSFWRELREAPSMTPATSFTVGGVDVKFLGERPLFGRTSRRDLRASSRSARTAPLSPLRSEKREFLPSRQPTTEVGLLHPPDGRRLIPPRHQRIRWTHLVRGYFHPLVSLLWIGSAMMFFGGALSLTDRRFRLGAPRPPRARRAGGGRRHMRRAPRGSSPLPPRWRPPCCCTAAPAFAVQPDEILKDPALE